MSGHNIHKKLLKPFYLLLLMKMYIFIKNVEEPPQWNYQLHIARLEYVQTFWQGSEIFMVALLYQFIFTLYINIAWCW